jgi:hypothetical protein
VLGGDAVPEPLDEAEVRDLRVAAFRGRKIRPALRKAAPALADRSPDPRHRAAVAAFLDRALDAVEEALGDVDPARPIDLRFIGDALRVKATAGSTTPEGSA